MLHGNGLANYAVGLEVYAHLSEVLYLHVYNLVWQTEFRDAIFEYTSNLVQSLEYEHVVALLSHVSGEAQSRWSGTHHGNLHAVGWLNFRQRDVSALPLVVGSKSLQISYCNGRFSHLGVNTSALALFLLWTHASAHGRQGGCLLEHFGCVKEMSSLYVLDERRDIDVHRTSFHACWLTAVQAPLRLGECHFWSQSLVDLLQSCCRTVFRVKLRHDNPCNCFALGSLHRCSELLSPISIAVGE